MNTIVFCCNSEKKESGLFKILCRNLPQNWLVTALSNREIMITGNGKSLLLYQTNEIPILSITGNNRILLVFSENFQSGRSVVFPDGTLCIAASDNTGLLRILAKQHAHVITCGMSPKDTFTYSGKNESSISVSLQRELASWNSGRIEPMEVVFTFSQEYSDYDLLAYSAIAVLLGNLTDESDCQVIL